MAWPPPLPPATRANATLQLDNHPNDHNLLAAAIAQVCATVPLGRLASVYSVSAAGGITAAIDLVVLPAVTTVAGHRYLLVGKVHLQMGAAAGHVIFGINEGATVIESVTNTVQANAFATEHCWVEIQPAAGPHTYKATIAVTGGGTGQLIGGAGNRAHGLYLAEVACS